MTTINYAKASALGLNPQDLTVAEYIAALNAAGENDLTPANAPAILDAVVEVIRADKQLTVSLARELAHAKHPTLSKLGRNR